MTGHQLACPAVLLDCPFDPELGVRLYEPGAAFSRREFVDSLAGEAWPDGSRWHFAIERGRKEREWIVDGPRLIADDGEAWEAVDTRTRVRLEEVRE